MFKQQLYEDSLTSFFGLLDRQLGTDNAASGDRDPAVLYAAMGRAQQELVDDTFRVLSIGFSYLDGPESISRHFNRRGARPYAFIAYTNLGDLYLEQERYQDAADAYHAFVELDPYHAKAPLLQVEVVEAFKKGAFADLVLEGKENFVETYGPGSPYWQRFTFEQQPEVVAHLKSNVTDLAAYHHAEAQKTKESREYAAAARWYRTYLAIVPRRRERRADELPARRGALRERQFPRCRGRVRAHGVRVPVPRQAAAKPATRRCSRTRSMKKSCAAASGPTGTVAASTAACGSPKRYPAHAQAATVQTDAAEKLFALGEFARARDVGRQVVARTPAVEAPLQRTAWTVVAHSEFDLAGLRGCRDGVRAAGRVRAGRRSASDGEITERIASSIYKQGEQARSAGQLDAAVDHFLRVAQAAPSSPVRATAEYDAGAALIQLGDWQRATTVLENFRSSFPDSRARRRRDDEARRRVRRSRQQRARGERVRAHRRRRRADRSQARGTVALGRALRDDGPERGRDGGIRPFRRALSAARGRGRRGAAETDRLSRRGRQPRRARAMDAGPRSRGCVGRQRTHRSHALSRRQIAARARDADARRVLGHAPRHTARQEPRGQASAHARSAAPLTARLPTTASPR